jgi:hypothetical protein
MTDHCPSASTSKPDFRRISIPRLGVFTHFVGTAMLATTGGRMMEDRMTKEPTRSRAVFSTEDFGLMKEAVADYVRKIADEPKSVKFANLYHRLGRLG